MDCGHLGKATTTSEVVRLLHRDWDEWGQKNWVHQSVEDKGSSCTGGSMDTGICIEICTKGQFLCLCTVMYHVIRIIKWKLVKTMPGQT